MDLDHETGGAITGWDGVMQSILTILSTPLDTRVFRREFGSKVPELIDAPMNDAGILALYVAVAEALEKWEPRFELTDVTLEGAATGVLTLSLSGNYRPRAHLGDLSSVLDETRAVRIQRDRAQVWSLAA
ncbi:GPW/gp25 family protein [Pararhodobacter sp. CCB-MM2]|uniref:GPW/gp25 family protein n=1 Tax=Pararhodobacter sp. CCB-MM2 TaxID=1786003 RepID=UPI00082E8E8A|nr:GPW/gp25 family protein [Pararhodobacter sp. CCB-MM2]